MKLLAIIWFLMMPVAYMRLMFMELDPLSALHHNKHFDNQHIVMVGDSLMRYQYLSLVHLIHTNSLVETNSRPNILMEKTFGGWAEFFNASNAAVAPLEYCDCSAEGTVYENRYYFNKQRNISLSFVAYAGEFNGRSGSWLPAFNEDNHVVHPPHNETPRWTFNTVEEIITNVAAKLNPKPTTLVLNAGHWGNKWNETAHRDGVLGLAKSLFPRVIWKTTNHIIDHSPGDYQHDAFVCSYPGVECMNLDWTQHLDASHYWDRVHFMPDVYTDINLQFMHQILKKKPLAAASMASEHYFQIVNHGGKRWVVDKVGILRPFTHPTAQACVAEVEKHTHIYMSTQELANCILGELVPDICELLAG